MCRPRFDCSSRRAGSTEGSFDQTQAFTDGINQGVGTRTEGLVKGRHYPLFSQADLAVSFSDLSDLPKEVLDGSAPSGPIFAPIITEEDENRNNFIREMKENCTRDQLDYCVGQDWQHPEHTMCKFCVSQTVTDRGRISRHAHILFVVPFISRIIAEFKPLPFFQLCT